MNIPVIIINRDRLSTTEKLCDQLLLLGYSEIHIMDMGSTYEPLLEWYINVRMWGAGDITIHYLDNQGHKGIWNTGILKDLFGKYPWVAVTDSDIELNMNIPMHFIDDMVMLAKDFRVDKVGLAIDYTDIPNPFLAAIIQPIESRYWQQQLNHKSHVVYNAPVDTSFCVVNPNLPFTYNAIRVAGNYTCIHKPWLEQWDNLTEEQQYYMDHCDANIGTIKQHYLKWIQNH